MGYPDDFEHTAALSELLDVWVRNWARRYVSRRDAKPGNGTNLAMNEKDRGWRQILHRLAHTQRARRTLTVECRGQTRCTTTSNDPSGSKE